jgi:hypothetical protein
LPLPWLRPPRILAPGVASFKGGRSIDATSSPAVASHRTKRNWPAFGLQNGKTPGPLLAGVGQAAWAGGGGSAMLLGQGWRCCSRFGESALCRSRSHVRSAQAGSPSTLHSPAALADAGAAANGSSSLRRPMRPAVAHAEPVALRRLGAATPGGRARRHRRTSCPIGGPPSPASSSGREVRPGQGSVAVRGAGGPMAAARRP